MALAHNPKISTNGLVLCLDAANTKSYPGTGTGTEWKDLSGNGNDGTLVNGVGFSSENNGAMVFDGTNSYATINNFSSLANSPACTISLVSLVKSVTGYHFWGNRIFLLQIQSESYRLRFNLDGDWRSTYNIDYPLNTYHKLDIVWDGTTTRAYVNAVEIVNSTSDSSHSAFSNTVNQPLEISRRGSDYSDSEISNVQIYNRALSPEEIRQNFQALRGRYGI